MLPNLGTESKVTEDRSTDSRTLLGTGTVAQVGAVVAFGAPAAVAGAEPGALNERMLNAVEGNADDAMLGVYK